MWLPNVCSCVTVATPSSGADAPCMRACVCVHAFVCTCICVYVHVCVCVHPAHSWLVNIHIIMASQLEILEFRFPTDMHVTALATTYPQLGGRVGNNNATCTTIFLITRIVS